MTGHHMEERFCRIFSAQLADNTLKSYSPAVMTDLFLQAACLNTYIKFMMLISGKFVTHLISWSVNDTSQ